MTTASVPAADLQAQTARAIADLRARSPLALIDVIIDRPQDAELLRRQIVGRGLLPGLVNVRFRSVDDVVESLPAMGIGPALVLDATVQATLLAEGGFWAEVADNPGTIEAVSSAVRLLRYLPAEPDTTGVEEQARAVVRIAAKVLAKVRTAGARPRAADLVIVAARRLPSCVERWLAEQPAVVRLSPAPRAAVEPTVYSCPDPLAEADLVARLLVAELAQPGARADGVAVLMADEEGLAPAVQAALDAAGVAWFRAAEIPLATTAAARSVVALLDLVIARSEGTVPRTVLFDWWASAPVCSGGEGGTQRWRSFIRRENLYGDIGDWQGHLCAVAAEAAGQAMDPVTRRRESAERRLASAEGLIAFLAELEAEVGDVIRVASQQPPGNWWQSVGPALLRLWQRYHRFKVPGKTPEGQALLRITRFLNAELPLLDAVDGYPRSLPVLRQLLAEHLATSVRAGDAAVGVRLGSLQDGLAGVYETTILAGMREGCAPTLPGHDPLLPDTDREILRRNNALSAADLPLAVELGQDQQRAFDSVMVSAGTVIATYSRASLRGRSKHLPSRFLPPEGAIEVPAFGVLPQLQPVDLRAWQPHRPDLLPRRLASQRAFADPQPDQYFGMLAAVAGERVVDAATEKDAWSATAIESFLHCPYGFFVQRILGFRVDEVEDELDEMRANDLGTILHEALERFVGAERVLGTLPGPGADWPVDAAGRLREILEEELRKAERQGLHGSNPGWPARRKELLDCLEDMLAVDSRLRAEHGFAPGEPELTFGPRGRPVSIALSGGRRMGLLGAMDRLDHTAGKAMVIDYKSGSMAGMRTELKKGGKVQHLIYAHAASQLKGVAFDDIVMAYLFVPNRGTPGVLRADVDAGLLADVVGRFDTELSAGRFLPQPAGNYDYCRVCQHLGRTALRLNPPEEDA